MVLCLSKLFTDAENSQNLEEATTKCRGQRKLSSRESETMEKENDKQQMSLDKDGALLSALLQYEGKGLYMGMKRDGIQIFLLTRIQEPYNWQKCQAILRWVLEIFLYQNRKFRWKTTVFDLLWKLIDETEDMSSDTYHEVIGENKEDEKHNKDVNKIQILFRFRWKYCSIRRFKNSDVD